MNTALRAADYAVAAWSTSARLLRPKLLNVLRDELRPLVPSAAVRTDRNSNTGRGPTDKRVLETKCSALSGNDWSRVQYVVRSNVSVYCGRCRIY